MGFPIHINQTSLFQNVGLKGGFVIFTVYVDQSMALNNEDSDQTPDCLYVL